MMVFRKISTLVVLAITLFATSGFNVTRFYCGSQLRSVHIITSPEYCCALPGAAAGRCHTETEYHKADFPAVTSGVEQIARPDFAMSIIQFAGHGDFLPDTDRSSSDYLNYIPPLLYRDISILFQSFLI